MAAYYAPMLRALALAGAVAALNSGFKAAEAQVIGDLSIADLIQSAQDQRPQDVVGLPGAELSAILSAASEAERAELLAALPVGDVAAMLAGMVQSGAEPDLIADVLASAVSLDPGAAEGLAAVVIVNSAPDELPALAAAMIAELRQATGEGAVADASSMEGLVQATLALDNSNDTVAAIVSLGESAAGEGGSESVAQALAKVADTTPNAALRSRIVTQVAVADGAFSNTFSQQRSEPAVGDITLGPQPGAGVPAAEQAAVPPPAIGGAGATSGQTSASQSGQRNQQLQTASSNTGGSGLSSGGGGASGGGSTSSGTPSAPVSPTN